MVGDEGLDGALDDVADGEPNTFCRLAELGLVIIGDAAYERDGEVAALIGSQMLEEEGSEVVDDHLPNSFIAEVAVNKAGKGGQETVGKGLAIDAVDDVGHRQACRSLEFI